MKDNTIGCLVRYLDETQASNPTRDIAKFVGVSGTKRIEAWAEGREKPKGWNLIRLRFFLHNMGFSVAPIRQLPSHIRDLGELVIFDVISSSDVSDILEFTEDSFRRLFLNRPNMTKARVSKAKALCLNLVCDLNLAKKNRLASLTKKPSESMQKTLGKSCDQNNADNIKTLSYMILAMLPLARRVDSDEFSAEDRRMLREMTERDGVFRLSNLLNRLCGEDARKSLSNSHLKEV